MQLIVRVNFISLNIFHYTPIDTPPPIGTGTQFENLYTSRKTAAYRNMTSLQVIKKKRKASLLCVLPHFAHCVMFTSLGVHPGPSFFSRSIYASFLGNLIVLIVL